MLIPVVEAFRCCGRVTVALPAPRLEPSLHAKSVRIGRYARIDCGAPLPLDRHPRRPRRVERSAPGYVNPPGYTAGRHRNRHAAQKDLIVSLEWNRGDPSVGHRTKRG